jgi:hypothetical protein
MAALVLGTANKSIWSFSPQSIPGLCLWMDGADTNTFTLSGSNVTTWKDKSVNAATTTSSGTVTYNSTTQAVTLGTTSSYMYGTWGTSPITLECTSFVVATTASSYNSTAGVGFNNVLAITSAIGSDLVDNGGMILAGTSNPSALSWKAYSERGTTNVAQTSTYNTISEQLLMTTSVTSGGVIVMSKNGASPSGAAGDFGTATDAAVGVTIVNFIIGVGVTNGTGTISTSTGWNSTINEVVMFNRALTAYEIANMEGYLAWKWKLQSLLPAFHPYSTTNKVGPFLKTFAPTDIAGCYLWMDGRDLSTITPANITNGTTVTNWNDKSGNAFNMVSNTQGTGFKPTFQNNGIVFVGSSNQGMSSSGTFIQLPNATVFCVANITSPNTGSVNTLVGPSSSNGFQIRIATGIQMLDAGHASYGIWTLSNPNIATSAGLTQVYEGETNGVSTAVHAYQNGVQLTLGSGTGNEPASVNSGGRICLGGRYIDPTATVTEPLTGTIYELILYSVSLTTAQRQYVEAYLMWKWNLRTPYFPTTLPFYTITPATYLTWNPKQITGCSLWIDAADASTVTGTSSVTAVADKSGNGYNLTGGSGFSYPNNTFNGTYPSFYNGNGGFVHSTSSRIGFNSSFAITTPFYMFVVAIQTTNAGGDYGDIMDSYTGSGRIYLFDTTLHTSISFGSALTSLTAFVSSIQYNGSSSYMYVNGTSFYTGTAGAITTGGINIGNRYSNSEAWPGHICEIIIYTGVASTAQRQQVEGYLAWKWGLQSSLAAGHPFKGGPPSYVS